MSSAGTAALLCTVLFLVDFGGTLQIHEFYPFGLAANDAQLPKNDDGSSGRVQISIPFPFFDRNFDSLFVNTNGAVSFMVQISQYTPDRFPLGGDRRLLSPFWADVDTRKGGEVWYREETTNQIVLRRATNDIRKGFVKQHRFSATWVYIVTWDQVAFYGSNMSTPFKNKRNTFQAVLITNGRHSFVIYNYNKIQWTTGTASGGSDTGLGGTPAQCGFNAGDGVRFYTINGSRTAQVLNLPTTSNIGRPGMWMFQIDNAQIQAGGCNTAGSLILFPSVAPMLGGVNIELAGPCYESDDDIVCEFDGKWRSPGIYVNKIRAICTAPLANRTGRLTITLSRDGGKTFPYHGIFTYVSIARMPARVARVSPQTWVEGHGIEVKWNPVHLDGSAGTVEGSGPDVMVRLARYSRMDNEEDVGLHSFFTVVQKQGNTGIGRFIVPPNEGDGTKSERFITLVQVMKTPAHANQTDSSHQWISSDLFTWQPTDGRASHRCQDWYGKQPDPKLFTEDTTFLHCPRNLVQAMADRGRFTEDEHCSLKNVDGCHLLHGGRAKTCFRSITPSDQGVGTQCCYNAEGNLMVGEPDAGSLDRVHTDTGIPYISHYFHDIAPYWDCCVLANDREERCHDYYVKRPSDNGQDYEEPRPAAGFGDPHMVTLDGVEYTFNGYGEFTLLRVHPPKFVFQGRMKPLTTNTIQGQEQSKATVYTAFAMRENGSDTVQIQLNGRGMVDVLVNGEIVDLEEEDTMEFRNVLVIKYPNVTKYSAIFHSGISVTVRGYPELLQMMLLVPQKFKGNTSGLLGFWDGDTNKEFLLPNGSFIDTESPAEVIHSEFGMKWLTTANESLFTYERGKNHSTNLNKAYTPVFIERGANLTFNNATLEREARDTCGENIQCLFDVSTTRKLSIGVASQQAVEEFNAIVNTTETKACAPLESSFPGGVMNRTDTSEGISYKFTCNQGFELNGTAEMSCKAGEWNGSKPNCVEKDSTTATTATTETTATTATTATPSPTILTGTRLPVKESLPIYAMALIGVGCGVLVALVIAAACCCQRRYTYYVSSKGQRKATHAQSTGQLQDQNAPRADHQMAMAYTNETYVSCGADYELKKVRM